MQTFKNNGGVDTRALPKIIGLTGSKGVGKSTLSKSWKVERDDINIMSFATPLKKMLRCIVSPEYIEDKEAIIPWLGVSARHCLQTLGTEWGRNINNDIWINLARHEIGETGIHVFDGVRFNNEAKMIKDMGGEIWKLTRAGHEIKDQHVSESGVDVKLIDKEIKL